MKIDVTVNSNDQMIALEEEVSERQGDMDTDLEVRYVFAPPNLSYTVPFPIVSFVNADIVMREYGDDAVSLFRRALSGTVMME